MALKRVFLAFMAPLVFASVARSVCSPAFGQCGGINWTGPTCCEAGSTCMDQYDSDGMKNIYYSSCIPAEHSQNTVDPSPDPPDDTPQPAPSYNPSVVDCQATMVISPNPPYVDLFGRSVLTYRRFREHKYCVVGDGSAMVRIHIRLMVISNGVCKPCNNPQCQFWHPDSIGNYEDSCSTSTFMDAFDMLTDMPGDESAQEWGPDPFPHIHYACCCDESCQANKFYMSGSHDFASVDGIVIPGPTNIVKTLGPKEFAIDIIIPEGSKRWWPRSDSRDIVNLRKSLGIMWGKLYDENEDL